MPRASAGTLEVLDVGGRRLWSAPFGAGGVHWTGVTPRGRAAPGVYLARITTGSTTSTRRFVWLE